MHNSVFHWLLTGVCTCVSFLLGACQFVHSGSHSKLGASPHILVCFKYYTFHQRESLLKTLSLVLPNSSHFPAMKNLSYLELSTQIKWCLQLLFSVLKMHIIMINTTTTYWAPSMFRHCTRNRCLPALLRGLEIIYSFFISFLTFVSR